MSIANPTIHLNCYYYEKNNPLIDRIEKEKGKIVNVRIQENYIIILMKGTVSISYGTVTNAVMQAGEMGMLPFNNNVILHFLEDSTLLVFKLRMNLSFCDHLPLETLFDDKIKNNISGFKFLKMKKRIIDYVENMEKYIEDMLKCSFFLELKIRELLYIIRIYYPYTDLQQFFNPIINKDLMFAEEVYQFSIQAKTIAELSEMMKYSVSGFEKKFKNVFGMSANKWIQQERAKRIYHELNCSTETIAEIGHNFGFTSPSHFNDYCKRIFKFTPGKIRKMNNMP